MPAKSEVKRQNAQQKPTPEPTDNECFRMLTAVLKSKDQDGKTAVRFILQAVSKRQASKPGKRGTK